ncbi:MAG TPA: 3',5'-cyclic-nucleotide phosphodiesterase [Gallionellaceae bacterium]|nr:3',5'-cyclic-nucleotide phosphodiesterase [Gallionellaceae bacterium]
MKLRILGCSGGISGNLRTTSMLLDHDVLIDSGTGVGDLSLTELSVIDHIFVTHSHLDHVACIPFLVDTVNPMRDRPLTIHATEATIEILRQHLFNWKIWPDFTQIPDERQPYMRYRTIEVGRTVEIGGRKITALPANHTVPAVGFRLDSGSASLVFSGDTTVNDALWDEVNGMDNLRYLIIETAFSNAEKDLAILSKHLCPSMLADELRKLKHKPEIYITHLKPGEIELTMQEISECVRGFTPIMLQNGQVFEF